MSSLPTPAPLPRPSARLLLLDEADRLLLFSSKNESDGSTRWYAVGGGLRPGESHEQAAVRELREETGLTGVTLGPEVWRGRPWLATWDGVTQEVRQRYFAVRAPRFEIDPSGFEEFEKGTVTGHRWWTVDELAATTDLLRPAGLAQLLAQLLAAGPPGEPISVDG